MRCLIMGAPGSGKGTYADGIKKHYNIPHISTGELFREAIQQKTPVGIIAKSYIDKGMLVPDEITIDVVKQRLLEQDCKNGFLLDGFPRTYEQAVHLDRLLDDLGIKLDMVVNLYVSEDIIVSRIINRLSCPKCHRGYNLLTLKPRRENYCDECNVPLHRRDDDNEELVRKRLVVYHNQTKPLIDYYEQQQILLHVDGAGVADVATKRVLEAMEAFR